MDWITDRQQWPTKLATAVQAATIILTYTALKFPLYCQAAFIASGATLLWLLFIAMSALAV